MKVLVRIITFLLISGVLFHPSSSNAAAPTELLRDTIDAVIDILKDPSLKGDARKEARRGRIRVHIRERFSFEDMSRRSLGKHWRERSPEEKKEFVEVFGKLIENTYIGKIEGYTDEKVVYENEVIRGRASEVKTKIITKDGLEIPINYRLIKKKSGDWLVYDVVIEGVSLVRNYRTQFSEALRSSSFSDLVTKLREKIEKPADES